MIYISADDYGLCDVASSRILQCADNGSLNKISVFPNISDFDLQLILKIKDAKVSLHLNLVEGKCMADAKEIPVLADANGFFRHTFGGLLKHSLFDKKAFEQQVYKEIKAQVLFWKKILPKDAAFCIDSHQHTHMIPVVFKALTKVLEEENITPMYVRIPAEPIVPYLKTPSLYFTYSPVNIIKQWLLKFLWLFNRKEAKKIGILPTLFMGILFSGKMDKKRVEKILPQYIKLSKKHQKDIEVLFHPGYTDKTECNFAGKNIKFKDFYFSENRKTEIDSIMKISKKEVLQNALY